MKTQMLGNYVRPDSLDFRDRIFRPTLIEVPSVIPLERYQAVGAPILSQVPASATTRALVRRALLSSTSAASPHSTAWACTGFALATVAHYLLRRRVTHPDATHVSEAMFFEMARRYDDYTGERYLGSSARGAMKGWYLHGICSQALWPFRQDRGDRHLTVARAEDAESRPLGAYFRVNHKDLVAMHCALAEVGVLFAVTRVHRGWLDARSLDGCIPKSDKVLGSHAIAIVAYDNRGFWIQNSWGPAWGAGGFGHLSYDDWLSHGVDAWVARLGVPTYLDEPSSAARITASAPGSSRMEVMRHLRSHLVRIHPDGRLQSSDVYGTSLQDLDTIFDEAIPLTTKPWKGRKRLLLYAGAGLGTRSQEIQRSVADYRAALLGQNIYTLSFIWRTGIWDALGEALRRPLGQRQPDSALGSDTDFLLDRLDDAIEPLARQQGGKLQWDEVKRTATQSTALAEGAVRLTLERLAALVRRDRSLEIHVVAHSAGALLMAPAIQLLTSRGRITSGPMKGRLGLDVPVHSCTLWAPACTTDLFHRTYYQAIEARRIRRFLLMTLTEQAEQADNVSGIYRKSLLCLISNALEDEPRVPDPADDRDDADGTEIMGMTKYVRRYAEFQRLLRRKSVTWMQSPSAVGTRGRDSSIPVAARRHGDFDDDGGTLLTTLGLILNRPSGHVRFQTNRSASASEKFRRSL